MNVINDNQQRAKERFEKKTRLVRGAEAENKPDAYPDSCQSLEFDVRNGETKQVGSYRDSDSRESRKTLKISTGGESPGKMLERLKSIEQAFLTYVRDNQQQLKAQLSESQLIEQNFLNAIEELQGDINSLVTSQQGHSDVTSPELEESTPSKEDC